MRSKWRKLTKLQEITWKKRDLQTDRSTPNRTLWRRWKKTCKCPQTVMIWACQVKTQSRQHVHWIRFTFTVWTFLIPSVKTMFFSDEDFSLYGDHSHHQRTGKLSSRKEIMSTTWPANSLELWWKLKKWLMTNSNMQSWSEDSRNIWSQPEFCWSTSQSCWKKLKCSNKVLMEFSHVPDYFPLLVTDCNKYVSSFVIYDNILQECWLHHLCQRWCLDFSHALLHTH